MIAKTPKITPALVAAHGLKPDEYARLEKLIGRTTSFTELGIFSAMWNEHCSYKSTRIHLRTLQNAPPGGRRGGGHRRLRQFVRRAHRRRVGRLSHPL